MTNRSYIVDRVLLAMASCCLFPVLLTYAQDDPVTEPIMQLQADGPTAFVTSLALSPNGTRLYAAGMDKIVRVWDRTELDNRFELMSELSFRVPVGPGLFGAINTIAVSPDGHWLAVAGNGRIGGGASDFRQSGIVVDSSAMSDSMLLDQGAIFVFETRSRRTHVLKGHRGTVMSLRFAPTSTEEEPVLVSAALERTGQPKKHEWAVRLWNPRRDIPHVSGYLLPGHPTTQTRAGLAIWQKSAVAPELNAVLAIGDQYLYRLNLTTRAASRSVAGPSAFAVSELRQSSKILATRREFLTELDLSSQKTTRTQRLPAQTPVAMACTDLNQDGRLDYGSVVVRNDNRSWQLLVFDLADLSLKATVPLWNELLGLPALAAQGNHIAVAGNSRHEVYVYSLADLLEGNQDVQKLRSVGATFTRIGFVSNGESLGLRLSSEAKQAGGSNGTIVMDFAGRKLLESTSNWVDNKPPTDNWMTRLNQKSLEIVHEQRVMQRVTAGTTETITAHAISNLSSIQTPIVAVASSDRGQPRLRIIDARTGTPLREFTGHIGLIRSVAFSGDGRLLTSVADDQTAAVWDVSNLDIIHKKRGTIPNLVVGLTAGSLIASKNHPAGIQSGDTIVGLVNKGELKSYDTPARLYLAISTIPPGSKASVRINRAGRQSDISMTVEQAIDEQKPLFSLFVTREHKWIGWSPLGPYDASDTSVERLIGWHFNTGRSDNPTSFAPAGEYQQQYRRKGFLNEFLNHRPVPEPRVDPRVSIWIDDSNGDLSANIKVATGNKPIDLNNTNAIMTMGLSSGFPSDEIGAVRWKIDGGQFEPFPAIGEREWTADLSKLDWTNRSHRIEIRIERNSDHVEFPTYVTLHYKPSAPTVKLEHPENKLIVQDKQFRFRGTVTGSEPAHILLLHHFGDETIEILRENASTLNIDETIELRPGENKLSLTATNRSSPAARILEESSRADVTLHLSERKQPPVIRISRVLVGTSKNDGPRSIAIKQDETVIVDSPLVTIEGVIQAGELLNTAHLISPGVTSPTVLSGFQADDKMEFAIRQNVSLSPGAHEFTILTSTRNSDQTSRLVRLEYRPQLSTMVITSPVVEFDVRNGKASTEIGGTIEYTGSFHPFQADILVNGTVQRTLSIDQPRDTWTSTIELQPGNNWVSLELTNKWLRKETGRARRIGFWRPPKLVELTAPDEVKQPFAKIQAVIESPDDLPITTIRINERHLDASEFTLEKSIEQTQWLLIIQSLALNHGNNAIELSVRNRDGWSDPNKAREIFLRVPPPPKPEVQFLGSPNRAVSVQDFPVYIHVRSASRIEMVEVRHGGEIIYRSRDIRADTGAKDQFEAELVVPTKLKLGLNQLVATVTNAGGAKREQLMVSYTPPPVSLEVQRMSFARVPEVILKPQLDGTDTVQFDGQAPDSRARIVGQAVWIKSGDPRDELEKRVSIWINGHLQRAATLSQPTTLSDGRIARQFEADVVLNREDNNLIEIELPGLEKGEESKSRFLVNCKKHEARRRLHLLIVGLGELDQSEIVNHAARVLQARVDLESKQFSAPGFEFGKIYGPLTGTVEAGQVRAQLVTIRKWIERNQRGDSPVDVVMIYYQGDESVSAGGASQLVLNKQAPGTEVISGEELRSLVAGIQAATMIWLDVTRAKTSESAPEPWPDTFRAAVFRYAWLASAPPPDDARLLSALEQSYPRAKVLGQLEDLLGDFGTRMSEKYSTSLRYEPHLHKSLSEMVVER